MAMPTEKNHCFLRQGKVAKRQRMRIRCLWPFWRLFSQHFEWIIAHVCDYSGMIWRGRKQPVAFPKAQCPRANLQPLSRLLLPDPIPNRFFLKCSPSVFGSLEIGKLRVQTGQRPRGARSQSFHKKATSRMNSLPRWL